MAAVGRTTLRIGAHASNGMPPVADAIVSQDRRAAGFAGDQGASPEEVAQRIAEIVGTKPEVLPRPGTQRAFLVGANTRYALPYASIDNGDNAIQMNSDWVRCNIVRAQVPIFGEVSCHRLMIDQLRGAP